MAEKQKSAFDILSWHWANESGQVVFDRYQIDSLYQMIRDLKDENAQLNDDIDNDERKMEEMKETIDELNRKIYDMEVKYNQLWHEA